MRECPRCGLGLNFVPKAINRHADDPVNIRVPAGHELWRCCAVVGDDCQSGPLFCGDRATLVADSASQPGLVIAACKEHEWRIRQMAVRYEKSLLLHAEIKARAEAENDVWDAH